MITRRKFLKKTALLSSLFLGSCGWRLANVSSNYTQASQLDQLYIFTWSQYTEPKLLQNFSRQLGIKVLSDEYDSNDAMLAKLIVGGGGTYSIIYPSDYFVKKMLEQDLLIEIDHSKIVGLENLSPRFKNPIYDPGNRYSIPFAWGTTGLLYNSEKLETPPEDWEYLWQNQRKLHKRVTLVNDVREVMGAALKMLGYSYNSQNETELKQAYEKLRILKPSIASFATDAWQNQILAGDLLIAMCYSGDAVKVAKENPKLKYIVPRSGSSLWIDTIVIPKNSPNLAGAYAWINLNLTPQVAAEMTQLLKIATPNRAGFELLPQQLQTNTDLFPPDPIVEKCESLQPLGKFEEVYQTYWNKLLTF